MVMLKVQIDSKLLEWISSDFKEKKSLIERWLIRKILDFLPKVKVTVRGQRSV